MTAVQNLGRLAQTGQSLALVGYNFGKLNKKKLSSKDMVEIGTTNIVGTGLIKATGTQVGLL